MTCKELIEYLSRFTPDETISIVVADIDKRIYYKISGYQLIEEFPALMFETNQSGNLDEIAEEADHAE